MLTRRHIRIKVMQCIYAMTQSDDSSLQKQEKFLEQSIENTYVLYLLIISLFREIHTMAQKYVAHAITKYVTSDSDAFPDPEKFQNNNFLKQISSNTLLTKEFEKRKLKNWYLHEDYVKIIYKAIVDSSYYREYMSNDSSTNKEDKELILDLFKEVIAPNDKIYEYFEDDKLTWVDDIPLINTFVLKQLKQLKGNEQESFFLPKLMKDSEDMRFAKQLLTKTLVNNDQLEAEIQIKTPKWDKDRIANIDAILMKMAMTELLYFPSIPERVTINEYLEIAKEYSTPKSSIFINGILDKLVKEYREDGKLKKSGRGLL